MKGLLIEDDQIKESEIVEFIQDNFPSPGIELISKKSYQSGIKTIFEESFDFILLDMSIPTYDQDQGNFSGKPRNFGGRDILKEMKRYKKESNVLVITQYNEFDGGSMSIKDLDEELRIKYSNLYKGYVYYKTGQTEWEINLLRFINSITV
jgi:DNA-binding NtrC family response regulator